MPLQIVTVPCLTDNYAWILHDAATSATAVVDVPEAGPILAALETRGWQLSEILITHHHDDHIMGVPELRAATGAKVTGAKADSHRLPPLDRAVSEGDSLSICGEPVQIFDVSGHTVGHIAFYFPQSGAVFTADSLMGLGCGHLFEGTPQMMWASLGKLMALPPETLVCQGHEYSASNAKFALTIEPGNVAVISRAERIAAARAKGTATVPVTLQEELETNPFLRATQSGVKAALGLSGVGDAEVFAEIRHRKDVF